MLSNENPFAMTSDEQRNAFQFDLRRAKALAQRLVTGQTNPDPREAENPSRGVRIRRVEQERQYGPRPHVSPEISAHNAAVANLRKP